MHGAGRIQHKPDPVFSYIERDQAHLQELWTGLAETQAIVQNAQLTTQESKELLKRLDLPRVGRTLGRAAPSTHPRRAEPRHRATVRDTRNPHWPGSPTEMEPAPIREPGGDH
jgi:hypothetical protein